ncbi:PilN domain-containing protein [Kozakia baliensis]|uniref:PilN domain-containing protein n=1 Tax=Kozakia baliensis TaxID=153496 RepID=UPI00116DF0C8|nr:PilN domain-containing protein [Kozakia baliensis]GEL65534.1 hypothetical protein KBA01_28200 [Kozakia baliensis]
MLRCAYDMILQRDVTLPLATEHHLEAVVPYEMDRFTPFSSEAVYATHEILFRDPNTQQIGLRLSLIPKAFLTPALDVLSRLHIRADRLQIEGKDFEIPLKDISERKAPFIARYALAGVCVLIFAALLSLGFWQQSVEARRLSEGISALRPAAMEAVALRQTLSDRSSGMTLIAQERRRLGDPLEVLAAATRILPDDSYLTDFIMRQGQIIISGRSPTATALIHAFSRETVFKNPVFVAPVTRVDGENTSLFSLRATVGR